MTSTPQTPVPASVLLTHRLIKAKVAAEGRPFDAAQAYADAAAARHNAALEAEYRATMESVA